MSSYPEKLEWVSASKGHSPENAILAGIDSGSKIFVARAYTDSGMIIPGKLHQSHGCVYVSYNTEEHSVEEYEVLCGPPACLSWIDASGGNVPENSVPAGKELDDEVLYIGRVIHNGVVAVGKVHPSHGTCYIPYDGKEIAFEEYEVLAKNKLGQALDV